jgi:hypothetical protein
MMIDTYGTEHLTVEEFREALKAAKAGDVIVYAIGDLATSKHYRRIGMYLDLCALSRNIMRLAEAGEVTLTQRPLNRKFRLGGRCFEYRATKCQAKSSIPKRSPRSSLPAGAPVTV